MTFLGILLTVGLAEASTQIHVRNEAQIARGNVELGSIAEITSTNPDDERTLAGLILGESPKAGQSVVWTTREISKRLRPYSRVLQDAHVKLPDHITIRRVVSFVTREEITSLVETMLKATLPDPTWEVRLVDLTVPPRIDLPNGGSVQVVPLTTRPQGAASFQLQTAVDGKIVARQWLAGRVKYSAPVAAAERLIDARSHFGSNDVRWQMKDVTFLTDLPATKTDLDGATAKISVQPGTMVTRSVLEREIAIHFGEEVDVVAQSESLSVSTRGVSQQNGFVGDLVKVKSLSGAKLLTGTLVARGIVRVNY